MPPLVSFIVITHGRIHDLEKCLQSIQKQTYREKEILVVDNNPDPNFLSNLHPHYPEVNFVTLGNNRGPTGGRNKGVELAKGEVCFFIDDDVALDSFDTVQKVMKYFQSDKDIGGVSFSVYNSSGALTRRSFPRFDKNFEPRDFFCAYFSGGACAFRRPVFLKAKGYWETLFIGCEELDLAYRVLDLGYKFLWASTIPVVHTESKQAHGKSRQFYFYTRNRFLVAVRNLPWRYVMTTTLSWWGYLLVKSAATLQIHHYLHGIMDGLRGLPQALQKRKCLKPETIGMTRQLSGRLWF